VEEVPEGFLDTLDTMLDSMIAEIDLETKNKIEKIEKKTRDELNKIENLKREISKDKTRLELEISQELKVRRRFWFRKLNHERSIILEHFFSELQQMIREIPEKKPFFAELLKKLILETVNSVNDTSMVIHVTKGSKDLIKDFIVSKEIQVVDDLSQVGVVAVIPEKSITIENTLESRLTLLKRDIIIMINKMLFKDLEEPPWSVSKTLDILMQDFTD